MAIKEKIKEEARIFFLKNKKNIMEVRGESMYPTLKEGWSAEISPAREEVLKIGDIIVFDIKGELAVHRIINKINLDGKSYLLQKGDNKSRPYFIEGNRVIGRVSKVFDSDHREVPSELWEYHAKGTTVIFNLLNALYLILYRIRKVILTNK